MIHYQENIPRKGNDGRPLFRGRAVPYDEQDANGHWAGHKEWELVLTDLLRTATDQTIRRQAEAELRICERKLTHWQRHRNWDAAQATRDMGAIRARASAQTSVAKAALSPPNAVG